MSRRQLPLTLALTLLLALAMTCRTRSDEDASATGSIVAPSMSALAVYIPIVVRGGEVYYVSTEGDDRSSGRTETAAFRTLGHALGVAQSGATIRVLPGTYSEAVMVANITSTGLPITIRGAGTRPVFDGQRTMSIGFWCERCANLVIENLEFRDYTDVGVGVLSSSQITMRDLAVHHNGFAPQLVDWEIEGYGIHVDESQHVLIESSQVHNNGPQPRPWGTLGTGINTYMCTDCVIRSNSSYGNIGGGILVEDGTDVLVEGNEVFSNYLDATEDGWWDGGIWIDGGRDIIVRNNLFRDNVGPGIEISDEDHQQPHGYVVENNISRSNYYGIFIWNFGTSGFPPESLLRMTDNQFYDNSVQDIWIEPWF